LVIKEKERRKKEEPKTLPCEKLWIKVNGIDSYLGGCSVPHNMQFSGGGICPIRAADQN